MTTMLERAASEVAMIPMWRGSDGLNVTVSHGLAAHIVRAVLMAVREPDDAVKKKLAFGDYTTFSYGGENSFDYLSEDNVAEFSRDLIDAILAGDA